MQGINREIQGEELSNKLKCPRIYAWVCVGIKCFQTLNNGPALILDLIFVITIACLVHFGAKSVKLSYYYFAIGLDVIYVLLLTISLLSSYNSLNSEYYSGIDQDTKNMVLFIMVLWYIVDVALLVVITCYLKTFQEFVDHANSNVNQPLMGGQQGYASGNAPYQTQPYAPNQPYQQPYPSQQGPYSQQPYPQQPYQQTPFQQPPIQQPPVQQVPVQQPPVQQVPIQQNPQQPVPVKEVPPQQPPVVIPVPQQPPVQPSA